jgi:CBS domain containing-hemolysin-like protein
MKLTPQLSHNKEEKKMLEGIIEFADKTVKDAMTSRSEITFLETSATFSEVLKLVVDQKYSRIPVCEETEDHIKGILYIKDLLPYLNQPDSFKWQDLIRPAYYVPENKMVDDLLDDFRRKRLHMAIVVDEFGGTSGLITMEDVLEEIVGEIRDEYDEDDQTWQKVGANEWVFEARTSLNDFCRVTGIDADNLGDKADNCESLGGLLLEIKQNFPRVNETLRYRGIEFTVLSMERRRIDRVKVKTKTSKLN